VTLGIIECEVNSLCTDSGPLLAEYCTVGIPHNTIQQPSSCLQKRGLCDSCQHHVTSGRLTSATYTVLETDAAVLSSIFSTMRQYFLSKFGGVFTKIFRNIWIQFYQDALRFANFIVHYLGGYFFPDTV